MIRTIRSRKNGWVLFGLVSVVAGCTTMNGGGGMGGDGASSGDLSGLFDADEAWVIGSQTMFIFGFGSKVEFVIGSVESPTPLGCLGQNPGGVVSFSNNVLTMDLAFDDGQIDQRCTVELTTPVQDCQAGGICELVPTRAAFSIGDQRQSLSGTELTRLTACDPTPSSLPSDVWSVLNVHPLLVTLVEDPVGFGVPIMIVAGQGPQTLAEGVVLSGVDASGDPVGCIDNSLEGTVSFDGQSFAIDANIEGRDNPQMVGVDGQCDLGFSGSMTYCAELNPDTFGSNTASGPTAQIIRVDGDGSGGLSGAAGDDPLDAVYILLGDFDAAPGGGPGTGVRVKAR